MKRILLTSALLACGFGLTACKSGGRDVVTTTPPPPAARFADQFGSSGFGPAYAASPNSEPRDVAAGDVIAVSPTAEPVDLPTT